MEPTSSTSVREILAVFRKEAQTELRTRSGLTSVLLFGIVTVVTLAVASFNRELSPALTAGLIWAGVLFSGAIALPRAFLLEEEQQTADLLRMWAHPHAVFWGKALFNLVLMVLSAGLLAGLFLLLASREARFPAMAAAALLGGSAALAGAVTLCGALVASAGNRATLAGAIALPLMLPLVFLAIEALKVPLGAGTPGDGWRAVLGLLAYGTASLSIGPYLYAMVSKR